MSTTEYLHYLANERHDEYDNAVPLRAEDRDPEYDEAFGQEEETPALQVVRVVSAVQPYAYEVVHRTNVYRLNDGFWDCYRENELQAA